MVSAGLCVMLPSHAESPLPDPSPLGEGTRLLPPAGGGWEGGRYVFTWFLGVRASCPQRRDAGVPARAPRRVGCPWYEQAQRYISYEPCLTSNVKINPRREGWGNRVSPPPAPGKVRAQPLRRGMGKPGFPIPLPAGGSGRAAPSQEGCSSRRCAAEPHGRLM